MTDSAPRIDVSHQPNIEEASAPDLDTGRDPKMRAEEVSVFYGEKQALKDVSIKIYDDLVTAFIGPSGCGKSTFLRCLNRMNDTIPTARVTGRIALDDEDITSSSMKASEAKLCAANGVSKITEIQVGLDGVTFATAKNSPLANLSQRDIYLALAKTPFGKPNRAKTWKDVNGRLPAIPIRVYGPPTTSGTRDALGELIMWAAARSLTASGKR